MSPPRATSPALPEDHPDAVPPPRRPASSTHVVPVPHLAPRCHLPYGPDVSASPCSLFSSSPCPVGHRGPAAPWPRACIRSRTTLARARCTPRAPRPTLPGLHARPRRASLPLTASTPCCCLSPHLRLPLRSSLAACFSSFLAAPASLRPPRIPLWPAPHGPAPHLRPFLLPRPRHRARPRATGRAGATPRLRPPWPRLAAPTCPAVGVPVASSRPAGECPLGCARTRCPCARLPAMAPLGHSHEGPTPSEHKQSMTMGPTR
nr:DBF4-type zinc finger-containing protein 2 homolog [Aegilops tauschii subsp. strangulata]